MAKRRRFAAGFEACVAKEALRGDRTIQRIAARHGVHPNQVSQWKRKASEGLVELFERGGGGEQRKPEGEIKRLRRKIGQLVVERDFLRSARERRAGPRAGAMRGRARACSAACRG